MEVQVEISENYPAFDELKNLERLRDTITRKIEVVLGVDAKITLVEPRSLMRDSGAKARRVIDKRTP
jgi:phenylacetate-CoA ligase